MRPFLLGCLVGLLEAAPAAAFPGILVGKDEARRTIGTSHVILLMRGGVRVVTVAADYAGPLSPMVWLLPVPADVTPGRLHTAKRELVGRLEQHTAPRYHEFYEMNPCDPGEAQQEWEYAPKVENPGLQVGTRLIPRDDGPVPREIGMAIEPVFADADSPYAFTVLERPAPGAARQWLERRGFRLPRDAEERLQAKLVDRNLLLAEVNPDRLGLVPGGAELAPIRFWSESGSESLPATLGHGHLEGFQDLVVYVLADERYAADNYQNLFPPTNLTVAPGANERLSELHDALTDALLLRHPKSALTEFVWPTDGCGEPCPNAPLLPQELLGLGGDVVEERTVSAAERHPDPAPETPAEELAWKIKLKSLKPAERPAAEREHRAERKELARRWGLIARQRYVLTRLRWHSGRAGLPEDPRLVPAPPVRGGIGVPRGPTAELGRAADRDPLNRFQVRYVRTFSWTGAVRCEEAERWRWGRRWASLGRSWHKVWTATALGRKPAQPGHARALLVSDVPELGSVDAGVGTASRPAARAPGCGCLLARAPSGGWWIAAFVWMAVRRRFRREGA